jgi:hypothetical protein
MAVGCGNQRLGFRALTALASSFPQPKEGAVLWRLLFGRGSG